MKQECGHGARPLASRLRLSPLLAAWLLPALAGCQNPSVALEAVEVAGMDFRKVDLVFQFKVTNPNSYQVSLWGLKYELSAGGIVVASGALPTPVTGLSGNQAEMVSVPVAVEYARLAAIVSRLPGDAPVDYELSGWVEFNYIVFKLPAPIRHAGKMPPLRAPSWRLKDIRVVPEPTGPVEAVFEVDNPNSFPLPLASLKGMLTDGQRLHLRIDRTDLAPVPPHGKADVIVPLALPAEERAALSPRRGAMRFEGQLHLSVPPSFAEMLMGKKG